MIEAITNSKESKDVVYGGVVLILAFILRWLNSKLNSVHNTLTENNGGSTVKDQLDRIEHSQELTAVQLKHLQDNQGLLGRQNERMERTQERQESKMDAFDKKLNDHINNGKDKVDETETT